VASIDPRHGVFAALERRGLDEPPGTGWRPEEKLGFEDVVHAYTAGAAHAAGVGSRRGVLAPGFDADLVAWDVDPSVDAGDGDAFRAARAALTVVGGQVVLRR
jgi:predicted amidohydrolase YtcJ